ncbi:hypothetical protein GX51_02422 [Blastomyces parvus]|uniref:Uncharacterized protein n=1 Tax=Blastomyces parvus TaxID=2060905 RepID=A0A2B7XC13_9EURO|nr:hypothetical protein GX51_02422 [Blastomyces parvus]
MEGEEWTEEHHKKLKELVDARGREYTLDATALEEKLRNLSRTDARRRSTSTESELTTQSPDPEIEAIRAKRRADNLRDYNYLIERGGRPAFPLELAQANTNDFGEHLEMIEYWGQIYLGQRNQWVAFLTHQMRKRRSVTRFTKYQQAVHDYRKKEGIEGDIQLHFDEKQQSKMDTWKEYHYHQHRFLPPMREKAEADRKQREQDIADWDAGKRNPRIPEDMGWIHHVRTLDESNLDKYMGWIRWIESEFPKIEQECADSAHNGLDKTPCPAEEVEAKEPATLPSSHVEIEPPRVEKSPSRSRRLTSGTTKSLVASPRVSLPRTANPAASAKHLSHADLGSASLAPPSQSSTRATRRDVITTASRKARSAPIAETGSLRRSQRIIEMESRKAEQQAAQEAARQRETAPKVESRRDLRTQRSSKKSSKPTPPHSKPQGITKAQSSRKGKLAPAAKKGASDLTLKDDQQQAAQETPKSSREAAGESGSRKKESRSQPSRKTKPKAAPPQSRPQGVKKPQAARKGRPSRALKLTALAGEVTV